MLDLAEWAAIGDWLTVPDTQAGLPAREYAVAALGRLYRKVRKGGKDLAHETDAERHQLRKDAKKLRYASEFFAALFESKHEKRQYKSFVAALETLQDKLGLLNDLATAPAVLAQFGIADDRAAPVLLNLGKKKALLNAAAKAHEALVDTKRFWQ
jgi:CHAD domain-containing protein